MLAADDPQFLRALSTAASIAVAEFARLPRALHLDQAHSIAGEAVLRASKTYDPSHGLFAPYAASFVRQALRDLVRQITKRPGHLSYDNPREFQCDADERTDAYTHRAPEIQAFARDAPDFLPPGTLASLTPKQRAVVRGKYELRQSFAEIGAALRVTRQAAQRTHRRAIERLRNKAAGAPN